MEWIKASLHCLATDIELISDIIYSEDVTGLEIDDQQDLFDYLDQYGECWDFVDDSLMTDRHGDVVITFYVTNNESGRKQLERVNKGLATYRANNAIKNNCVLGMSYLKEEDWANNWKRYFQPLLVGNRVLICPEWLETPADEGRVVFKVDPGMSFGTGMHQSTQLCIASLEQAVTSKTRMLDLGCGSGILFLIGLLLGAQYARALDIDPNSKINSENNALLNNIPAEKFELLTGNIVTDEKLIAGVSKEKYDLITANIVADVIIGLLPTAVSLLKDDGVFITSGIVVQRERDVIDAFEQHGLSIIDRKQKDDWLSFTCKKA